jgi:hypothetical protein
MADKIYIPESIEQQPFPTTGESVVVAEPSTASTTKATDTVYTPKEEPQRKNPEKVVAVETISASLDTQGRRILGAYEFGVLGAIQVGTYVAGISGDLKISPDGIVARNKSGVTTFSLDGTTGDATFKGSISAGSVIVGAVDVGGSNIQIDGANNRIMIYDDAGTPRIILGYHLNGF